MMRLRVLDLGYDSAVRSQAVYHGVAHRMGVDDDPVLTLVNPATPYVCIGLHQDLLLEVDTDYCARAGLPVLRREVGGGAVYLDQDQMFFHFIYPRAQAPKTVTALYARFLAPVLSTYRALGVPATLRPINDIHVGGRKIGGSGAAQIGEATVVVGSFLFDFNTAAMARCLKVPSEKFRDKLKTSLDDYMTTLTRELGVAPPRQHLKTIFLREVAAHLGVDVCDDAPRADECSAIAAYEQQLVDPEWLWQSGRRRRPGVKITGGTHLTEITHKARGGLIRAQLLSRENVIEDIDISGDFTCFPASGRDALCAALRGLILDDRLIDRLTAVWASLDLDMPGVEVADLAQALRSARDQDD